MAPVDADDLDRLLAEVHGDDGVVPAPPCPGAGGCSQLRVGAGAERGSRAPQGYQVAREGQRRARIGALVLDVAARVGERQPRLAPAAVGRGPRHRRPARDRATASRSRGCGRPARRPPRARARRRSRGTACRGGRAGSGARSARERRLRSAQRVARRPMSWFEPAQHGQAWAGRAALDLGDDASHLGGVQSRVREHEGEREVELVVALRRSSRPTARPRASTPRRGGAVAGRTTSPGRATHAGPRASPDGTSSSAAACRGPGSRGRRAARDP